MKARTPWLVFAGALLVVVAVMAFVTAKLVGLERERIDADARGAHEEQVRLALWRLDSETTPLLMEEISVLGLLGEPETEKLVPPTPEHLHARFVIAPDETVRLVGEAQPQDAEKIAALVGGTGLRDTLPEPQQDADKVVLDNPVYRGGILASDQGEGGTAEDQLDGAKIAIKGSYSEAEQRQFNANELARRVQAVNDNFEGYGSSMANTLSLSKRVGEDASLGFVARPAGAVRPQWIGDELLLLRRVAMDDGEAIHGAWVNWPVLRDRLLAEIAEPLPHAQLVRITDDETADLENFLATLPVQLVPGASDVVVERAGSLLPSLALGWAGVLAAIVAVFAVLRWSLELSERRAAFVSTVTHELRTPLTTFRMYAEMLSEGMVGEEKRARYVATLRREADRLGELVENVLAYARIESDRAPLSPEALGVEALLDRMRERLAERCERAGLELRVDVPEDLTRSEVRVDPTAAEQILFNLVDNASKYGDSEDSPTVELTARPSGKAIALCVRDHGPGIAAEEQRTIFEPFAKAKADESGTKPGVGLGLALSRRLARQLGGDLIVENAEPGARFVLTLPRA